MRVVLERLAGGVGRLEAEHLTHSRGVEPAAEGEVLDLVAVKSASPERLTRRRRTGRRHRYGTAVDGHAGGLPQGDHAVAGQLAIPQGGPWWRARAGRWRRSRGRTAAGRQSPTARGSPAARSSRSSRCGCAADDVGQPQHRDPDVGTAAAEAADVALDLDRVFAETRAGQRLGPMSSVNMAGSRGDEP